MSFFIVFVEEICFGNWFLCFVMWKVYVLCWVLNELKFFIFDGENCYVCIFDVGCGFGYFFVELVVCFFFELIVGLDVDLYLEMWVMVVVSVCLVFVRLYYVNVLVMNLLDNEFDLIFCY